MQRYYFQNWKWSNNLREIDIGAAYEALDPKHSSAILGFHAFTGCDQTGKFYGKTKAFVGKH